MAHTTYGSVGLPENIVSKWMRTLVYLEESAEKYRLKNEGNTKKPNPPQDLLDTLLGPQLLKHASEAYWETASYIKADIPYPAWVAMSLEERARIIAYNRVSNAIEGLTRYATELRNNAKRKQSAQTKKPRKRK